MLLLLEQTLLLHVVPVVVLGGYLLVLLLLDWLLLVGLGLRSRGFLQFRLLINKEGFDGVLFGHFGRLSELWRFGRSRLWDVINK